MQVCLFELFVFCEFSFMSFRFKQVYPLLIRLEPILYLVTTRSVENGSVLIFYRSFRGTETSRGSEDELGTRFIVLEAGFFVVRFESWLGELGELNCSHQILAGTKTRGISKWN